MHKLFFTRTLLPGVCLTVAIEFSRDLFTELRLELIALVISVAIATLTFDGIVLAAFWCQRHLRWVK